MTKNDAAWIFLGVPALLGWIAFGSGWLLDPHLVAEVVPLMWSMYLVGVYYLMLLIVIMIVCGGGAW